MQKERKNNKNIIIPQRLRDARTAAGKTIKEVAQEIGITAQALSMYELGRCNPSMEMFSKLRNMYNLPYKYYFKSYESNVTRSQIYFRSFSSATKRKREIYCKRSQWFTEQIFLYINTKIKFPVVDHLFVKIKESYDIERREKKDIESIAKFIREEWNLGYGPIGNLTRELEKKGIIIVLMAIDGKIDGFSFWENERPFIFVNRNNTAVRLRMSIAHELCHLFLHEADDVEENHKLIESEAKYFASAFLMPDISFSKDICSGSIDELLYLKNKWLTSIASMIMRCEQLELLSDSRIIYLNKQLSRKHYRKKEPYDDEYELERPILLNQAINLLIENNILSKDELLNEFLVNQDFIEEVCQLPDGYFARDDNIVSLFN